MRSESELMAKFNEGREETPAFRRERVMVELMIDLRSLMTQMVQLHKDEQDWRNSAKVG